MFSKREKKSTRFTNCLELNEVENHLETLRSRAKSMQAAAQEVDSLSYNKFHLLQKILRDIDGLISEFNDTTPQKETEKELVEARQLLIEIHRVISKISIHNIQTLLTFRDDSRNNIKQVILYGSMGAGIAAGAALSGPVGALCLMFGGAYLGSKTNQYAGLSGVESLMPESMKILQDIGCAAGRAIKAITKRVATLDSSPLISMDSQKCQLEDRYLSDPEIKTGIFYICRAKNNDFLAYAWRKTDDYVERINLNDFMQENEKFKNYLSIKHLDESRQKAFLATMLQGSNRFCQSQYDEQFQVRDENSQKPPAPGSI